MTDSFNISISGEDILARLIAAERNNESLTAYIQRVETDLTRTLNRLDDQLNDYAGAFEQRLDTLEPLVQDCIAEALDAGEKADMLNDRVKDYTLALREMTRKPNAPEPPVDTAWHPYDVETEYLSHPRADKRVVVMLRNGEINRPDRADAWDWSECEHRTIVAWRNAKEGE